MKKSKFKSIVKELIMEIALETEAAENPAEVPAEMDDDEAITEAVTKELEDDLNEAEYAVKAVGDKFAIVNAKTGFVTKQTFASKAAAEKYAKAFSGKAKLVSPKKKIQRGIAKVQDAPHKLKNKVKQIRPANL